MELSNNETFDEATNKSASDHAVPSKDICRLRHGLNAHCLLKVFDYLRWDDLRQLCKMDPYFKDLITNRTIKQKMIKLPRLYPHRYIYDNPGEELSGEELLFRKEDHPELIEMFETFGKSIGKFRIRFAGLSDLLELIMEYCAPNTLTEIELYLDRPSSFGVQSLVSMDQELLGEVILPVDRKLLDQSMPFFSNLRKLLFSGADASGPNKSDMKVFSDFLEKFLLSATNLQELYVVWVDTTGGWLQSCTNLRELRIKSYRVDKFDDLATCLKMNSKLKVFHIHYRDNDLSTIGDVFSEFCPNLENFNERHKRNPYNRFDSIINRYNFLSTLPHLRRVTLTTYTRCGSDLYYPLKLLAKSNIVKLKIYLCDEGAIEVDKEVRSDIMKRWLPDFPNIQTLTLYSFFGYADFDFIFHLTKQMKNLKTFKFQTCYPIPDIYKVLELAPSIRTLDLSEYGNMNFDKHITNIVEILRRIRKSNGDDQHLLHLILRIDYKNYLKDFYADTVDIMTFSYFGRYSFLTQEQLDEMDEMYN